LILVAAALAVLSSPSDFAAYYSPTPWERTEHQQFIGDAIADAVFAKQVSILLVECPPQHGKSAIVSQWTPAWFLSKYPRRNVAVAAYEAGVAARWGRWVRDTLTEIGTVAIASDSKARDAWNTADGGGMLTVGVGGPLTSYAIHLLIVDDPFKNAEEADSEVMRAKVWDWFQTVAWTRKQPGTVFVIMHTRWHEDDLVGRILANAEMAKLVRRVRMPALAEENDVLGRRPGEALWPGRFPANETPDGLLTTKAILSARWWEALYQQRPTAAEGAEIMRAWWRFYTELPVRWEDFEYRLASWDGSFTDADTSDYVTGFVFGVYGGLRYVLDRVRARMTFTEACEAVAVTHRKWKCNASAVELAANGHAIVDSLQTAMPGVYGVKVGNNGKVARARAASPQIKAGNVLLPAGTKWADECVEEHAAFPLGRHDDQVDAMSQGLTELAAWQGVPVTHLQAGDNRFVPPHVLALQQRGVLGLAPNLKGRI
jgi:predicted phage terminase large subunit-like protein